VTVLRPIYFIFLLSLCLHASFLSATKAIVFLGAPCSGKGTQSILLKEATRWHILSIGNIIRDEKLRESDIHYVYELFKTSSQVIDLLKFGIIMQKISAIGPIPGIVLDSWPKNLPSLCLAKQALFGNDIPLVIELLVNRITLSQRANSRMICPNLTCGKTYGLTIDPNCRSCKTALKRRSNDNKFDFPRRINKYYEQRDDMHQAFKEIGIPIHVVDGNRSYSEIHEDILKLVKEYIVR
jgi:adenylate kinase